MVGEDPGRAAQGRAATRSRAPGPPRRARRRGTRRRTPDRSDRGTARAPRSARRPRRPASRRRPPREWPRAPLAFRVRAGSGRGRACAPSGCRGSGNGWMAGGSSRRLGVLGEALDGVDPEAVHATVPPEPHNVPHGLPHLGVPPVQVGLLGIEAVQVPAPGLLVAAPGRPAEGADPVVGRAAVRPHVPVGMLAEPGVLDRGVARHQVEEHAQAPLVRLRRSAHRRPRAFPAPDPRQ